MIIATYTLLGSTFGLIALIGFKGWEEHHEMYLFPSLRSRVGVHAHRLHEYLRAEFPKTASRIAYFSARLLRAYASFGLAKTLVAFERFLENALRKVRTAPRELERRGEASPFLREVAAYKRMLSRTPRKEQLPDGVSESAEDR